MASSVAGVRRTSCNILIVEDDPEIRESLAELLRLEGYEITTASNGVEALEVLEKSGVKPQLIILDILMPEMNGIEFLERRQTEPNFRSIPTMVLSCNKVQEKTAQRLGITSFLQKPVGADNLLRSAREICQEKLPS